MPPPVYRVLTRVCPLDVIVEVQVVGGLYRSLVERPDSCEDCGAVIRRLVRIKLNGVELDPNAGYPELFPGFEHFPESGFGVSRPESVQIWVAECFGGLLPGYAYGRAPCPCGAGARWSESVSVPNYARAVVDRVY